MTGKLAARLQQLIRITYRVEDGLLIMLLAGMIGFAVAQIILRNIFGGGLTWADPLLRILVLWVGLMGAMVATRQDNQIVIDVLTRFLSPKLKQLTRVIVDLFTTIVCAVIAYYAYRFVISEHEDGTIAFAEAPAWIFELILPIAFAVLAWRYLIYAIVHGRKLIMGDRNS